MERGDRLVTEDVTVSVYNAGNRAGLAGRTQEELVSRGFIAGDLGNAPEGLGDVRVVRVLAASRQDPAALLVARQFGENTFVQVSDGDLGAGVDVVVGDDYVGLVKAPRASPPAPPARAAEATCGSRLSRASGPGGPAGRPPATGPRWPRAACGA